MGGICLMKFTIQPLQILPNFVAFEGFGWNISPSTNLTFLHFYLTFSMKGFYPMTLRVIFEEIFSYFFKLFAFLWLVILESIFFLNFPNTQTKKYIFT